VAIGLLQQGNRYLIGLRPKDRPLPDIWELPGGKVMPGESLQEALVREWNEELGLPIVVVEFLWSDVFVFPDGFFEVSLFRVETAPGAEPTSRVHQQVRFATAAQIQELPVIDSMFYILRRI
jgi:8-oxo-dGTP diphosphatase